MSWFLIALIAPALWSVVNYLDKYLLSKYFENKYLGTQVIFTASIGFFLLPLVVLIEPNVLEIETLSALVLVFSGFLYIVAAYTYLIALKEGDTSTIIPIFQTIPVFSYILALLFLDEQLSLSQILASLLIIFGAVGLSLDYGERRIKIKWIVLFWMLVSSLIVAFNSFFFKYFAIETNYWVTSFWEYLGFCVYAVIFITFSPSNRTQFIETLKSKKATIIGLNASNEIINMIAKMTFAYATLLSPLALTWVVNGFQPLFALMYGIILTLVFPKIIKEDISKKTLIQKSFFIGVIVIGAILLNY